MKSVAIIGSAGQLGTDIKNQFLKNKWDVISLEHTDIQIENINSVHAVFNLIKPDFVISTAAFHKVDQCEIEIERAWSINAVGISNVSAVGLSSGFRTVYISTDYVFDGNKGEEYLEVDPVSPINVYGQSKAAGELAVQSSSDKNLILRVSSLFGKMGSGGKGGNFIETIIKKAKSGEAINVVNDIYMSPTYTMDASELTYSIVENDCTGIFHVNNEGSISWYEFAKKILDDLNINCHIEPVATDDNSILKRPKNSSMNVNKAKSISRRGYTWEDAVSRYLHEKGHVL
jgi:dTDP-4-dehydrorhamnose reductase